MVLRPTHVIVSVLSLGFVLTALGYVAEDRAKDILLGLGVNLLSSVVFFLLLELYWRQMQRANGKEVHGLDYFKFARNVGKSKVVRILGTFVYPLTRHPAHTQEREALLKVLREAVQRPSLAGVQMLFLNPSSQAARSRAAERKDDDVLQRMEETLSTLRDLLASLAGHPNHARVEVRLFSRTPPFALFQTDDFASISFYYRDRPISEVARYEFFMDSPLGVFVEKTFEDLWHDAQTVTLDDYLRAHVTATSGLGSATPVPVA